MNKRKSLSKELLLIIGKSAFISFIIFFLLNGITLGIIEEYVFNHDLVLNEFDWLTIQHWIFIISTILTSIIFSILFLSLLKEKINYIHKITKGINDFHSYESFQPIDIEGNNELTDLAQSINQMSITQQNIRNKEKALSQEKEVFIRSLSHDIRTPLTSILAYSEYLNKNELYIDEQKNYLQLIQKKAEQIRELTDILLDGNKRNLEYFENGKLLITQIVNEFEEELEDNYDISIDISNLTSFSGHFDVQELRRIFDNLVSNIYKYADANHPIYLNVYIDNNTLTIHQSNTIQLNIEKSESYQIGLNSIKRIAQMYDGTVIVKKTNTSFSITIHLNNL